MENSELNSLKKILNKYGLFAKKKLGQNFLIDQNILGKIVDAAELSTDDFVIEVGAGPALLSKIIAPSVRKLVSLEIDDKMNLSWQEVMEEFNNSELVNIDVLDYKPDDLRYKLVANIPYYITSPILKHFLRNQEVRRPDLIVLLIQKEVAQRICSEKKPTLLSWEIKVFGVPEIVCDVPPESFYPSPKVDSAVLKIRLLDKPLIAENIMTKFFDLLKLSYKQPRKTLFNNLSTSGKWDVDAVNEALKNSHLDQKIRPHQLNIDDWKLLFEEMKK